MSDTVLAAFISALISLIVSFLAITLQKRADLYKVQKEHEHGYAKALFDKRVEQYPELYNYLSGYAKIIRNSQQTFENLTEFKRAVDDWNNRHSLFFTKATSKFSSKFRYYLGTILNSPSGVIGLSKMDWENIRKLIGLFEDFLKAEIGIYAAKPVGDVDEFTNAYDFINELIERAATRDKGSKPTVA